MSSVREKARILGGIFMAFALSRLELQLFHIMGQHLKVVDPVITPQHTDESPDNVREEGGIKPGLEAGQRRLVGAGPHIRGEDIQLSGKGFAGVLLVVLDHA